MRFLTGLLVGAVLTLVVATAFNAPIQELGAEIRGYASDVWSSALAASSKAEPRDPTNSLPAVPVLPTAEDILPGEREPIYRDEASLAEASSDDVEPTLSEAMQPPSDPTFAHSAQLPEAASEPIAEEIVALPASSEVANETVVWESFHSEASARGFASRLERGVGHPFSVRKIGPAHYSVTYSFADDIEQARVAEQVKVMLGLESGEVAQR